MYQQYNPNPKGKNVGDCTVRAIAKATGKDWGEAYLSLAVQGYLMGDMPSAYASCNPWAGGSYTGCGTCGC